MPPTDLYGAVVGVTEAERVLIDTTVTVDGTPQPIKVNSVRCLCLSLSPPCRRCSLRLATGGLPWF